jgi:hypothetical protein
MGFQGFALFASSLLSYSQAESAADDRKEAQAVELEQATKAADLSDQANNKLNGKTPDTSELLRNIKNKSRAGNSGTLLTGAGGVNASNLNLGKTTLLGS